jgi:hypothetical protein
VAQGYGVERLYLSAPGAGWFVMDALDLDGGLGGALSLTTSYARKPLGVSVGGRSLAVVSDEALANIGGAISYDRFRFYLGLTTPVVVRGQSGDLGGYAFTGPSLDLGQNPDAISDVRLGLDARIVGAPRGPFRLGASAQLYVPMGARSDWDTDETFRGMFRLLFAGDARWFTYAGHVGAHVRPLDEGATPGGPRGHELLFGLAVGARLPFGPASTWSLVIGPEVFGATAFRTFFAGSGTEVEGLLTARFEQDAAHGLAARVKMGSGIGSSESFGAPDWRAVAAIEIFGRSDIGAHHR